MITRDNQRTFHRTLYGPGILETVTLLKRGNDQKQGTVTSYTLYDCRWSMIHKTGNTIQVNMLVWDKRTLHIPIIEMERIGVTFFNPLDRFVDAEGRYWQPEATTELTVKLLQQHWCVDCLPVNPPNENATL